MKTHDNGKVCMEDGFFSKKCQIIVRSARKGLCDRSYAAVAGLTREYRTPPVGMQSRQSRQPRQPRHFGKLTRRIGHGGYPGIGTDATLPFYRRELQLEAAGISGWIVSNRRRVCRHQITVHHKIPSTSGSEVRTKKSIFLECSAMVYSNSVRR